MFPSAQMQSQMHQQWLWQQQFQQQVALDALRQGYGDQLFVIVRDSLEAIQPYRAAVGFDIPAINPFKITGMILEACTLVELHRLLTDSPSLGAVLLQACDLLATATAD
jgi:hypothetical protein